MSNVAPTSIQTDPLAEAAHHLTVLGLLVPAWYCIGKLAQKAKLPQISGYVFGGIICGCGLGGVRPRCKVTEADDAHVCSLDWRDAVEGGRGGRRVWEVLSMREGSRGRRGRTLCRNVTG